MTTTTKLQILVASKPYNDTVQNYDDYKNEWYDSPTDYDNKEIKSQLHNDSDDDLHALISITVFETKSSLKRAIIRNFKASRRDFRLLNFIDVK